MLKLSNGQYLDYVAYKTWYKQNTCGAWLLSFFGNTPKVKSQDNEYTEIVQDGSIVANVPNRFIKDAE